MRRRSRGWVALTMALTSAGLMAQNPTAPIERMGPGAIETWPRVGIDVTVLDREDEPVKGLDASKLTILSDGKPVTGATLISADGAPESICLLVDTSGSTYADRDAVRAELLKFIGGLPDGDELCGIDFSSTTYVDLPLTTDRKKMTGWLSYLKSSGGTALYDALVGAEWELKHARFRSRAIVLISDGGENASTHSEQEVMESFHAAGAPVLYALENRGNPEVGGPAEGRRLLRLTMETGGLEFPIKHEEERAAAVELLLRAMAGRYRLEFMAANPVADGRERQLDIQLSKDLRKQKMNLVAARGYDAPLQ